MHQFTPDSHEEKMYKRAGVITQKGVNIVAQILKKEPEERMSLHEVMQHPWVTCRGTAPLPTVAASGLQVSFPPAYVLLGNQTINQFTLLVFRTHQGSQQTITGKQRTLSTKCFGSNAMAAAYSHLLVHVLLGIIVIVHTKQLKAPRSLWSLI